MTKKVNYRVYLSSPEWSRKRLERLKIDNHTCRVCHHQGDEYSLHVHHSTYKRLGDENVETDLITVCSLCHDAIHNMLTGRKNGRKELHVDIVIERVEKKERLYYGVENRKLPVGRVDSPDHAQWTISRPTEPVVKSHQGNYIENKNSS